MTNQQIAVAFTRDPWPGKLKPGDPRWGEFNAGFENLELTGHEILHKIATGHAFTAQHSDGWRHQKNFTRGQLIAVDMDTEDDDSRLENLVEHPFVAENALAVYTTPSHTEDKPRARILFCLDKPVETADGFRKAYRTLLSQFPQADQSCKDACRFFYGSPGCDTIYLGNVLPISHLRELYKQLPPQPEYAPTLPQTAPDDVKEALGYIDPNAIEYEDWVAVVGVLHDMGEFDLAESWADGKPGEVARMFRSMDDHAGPKAGVGTIYHIAKQFGFTPPQPNGEAGKAIRQEAAAWREHLVTRGKFENTNDLNVIVALLTLASERGTWQPIASLAMIRDMAGVGSTSTVRLAAQRLIRMGLLERWEPGNGMSAGQWFLPGSKSHASIQQREVLGITCDFDPGSDYAKHMPESAFLIGKSRTARRKARAEKRKWDDVEKGLGAVFLRIATVLVHRSLTRQEICDQTGISHATVKRHTLRGEELDLLRVEQPSGNGTEKVYSLNLEDEKWQAYPDIWERVKELEPSLRTYKLREEREKRDLEEDISHLTGIVRNTEDEEIKQEAERRLAYKQRKLSEVFARLHEEWSQEECDRAAYAPAVSKQYTAKQTAINKAIDNRRKVGAKRILTGMFKETRDKLMAAKSDLIRQQVPRQQWGFMLSQAGFGKKDIRYAMKGE